MDKFESLGVVELMMTAQLLRDQGQDALAEAAQHYGTEVIRLRVALQAVCDLDTRTDRLAEAQDIADKALYPNAGAADG